ncbi:hypothetical protein EHV15_22070 [Paenibacillus oralis]|uniref:F5/8 type C domain-containing protein n=1 Tax=Paenibacillus oralis TaxID=2490856 RepID=A0A3P3U4V5_9BACL|nr:hypothetical protein [Paenibacillus oralis]RRJ65295.1 hypothetical protein EHV15_22070 [Paenibacillus oralis]
MMIWRKCISGLMVVFYLLFSIVTPVSAEESKSSSLAFSIPANTFCDQSHTLELSLNITNLSSSSSSVKLVLNRYDGSSFAEAGTSYNGVSSSLIPGVDVTLSPLETATYHVSFGGKLSNCENRPFSGAFVAGSDDATFVASGFVSGSLGSVPIIINNGSPWQNDGGDGGNDGTPINTPIDVCSVENNDSLIHAMTSNSDQYGVAAASSYDTYYDTQPFRAFDNSCSPWESANGEKSGWIQYEFFDAKVVNKYSIRMKQNDPTHGFLQSPNSWFFEAYDGQEWVVLDTQSNVTDWNPDITKEFSFQNTTPYNKYRLRITANNGGNLVNISEIGMMGY